MANPVQAHAEGRAFNGAVCLATRDYGGDGPDLLFLPGAGQTLLDCDLLAPWLTEHHRVVAMDLRGHGASSDGPFSWAAALDDIDAVTATLRLNRPAVVGHSLGGMLAAMHGGRHLDCPGAVNLDGHGEPRPEHYEGMEPQVVAARLAELRLLGDDAIELARQAPELPAVVFEAMVAQYKTRFGLDEAFVREALERSHVRSETGVRARLSLEQTLEILTSVRELDYIGMYQACQAPLLVVNAMKPDPAAPGSPPWIAEHLAGFRHGLSLQLDQLCAELPQMTFVEIDATHALVYEQPELVAKQIIAFLAGCPSR